MQEKKQRVTGQGRGRKSASRTGVSDAAPSTGAGNSTGNGNGEHTANVDAVRTRAYYLYLERGAQPGRALDDWLEAERETGEPHPGP